MLHSLYHLIFIFLSFFLYLDGYTQSHKYYLENGIITASQLGGGEYELVIDTKSGAQRLLYKYKEMENSMYVYDLIKVDQEFLSEYQL